MIQRGDVYWVDLPTPAGSEPGYRRPVLVVSADDFNQGRISTAIAAAISSNVHLLGTPGIVELPASDSGLERDSIINLSQLITLDKSRLTDWTGTTLSGATMRQVDEGLAQILQLAS
ncbi:type II toxin-antitoxin system PemK/MazF family toxin [Candidatus Poriferisocius sp.]|uniref:type II toxin-antitoxin system PemK/MazF family toxin n=1 Tax=Candidatus Poriferisocius sp. TaxID=3101276 RepID=UPI003B02D328